MAEKATASRAAKKGLHGWKAFLVVFVSGTLAAFLVMGVIVGTLRLFVSTVTGGGEEEPPSAGGGAVTQQTGEPMPSMPPGKLDICSRTLPSISAVGLERLDGDEDFHDDAFDGGGSERIVRDECEWKLTPEYASTDRWDLTFSYEAILASGNGESREERADALYNDWRSGASAEVGEVLEEGDEDISDSAYVVYGEGEGDSTAFVLVGRVRSAVYQMSLKAPTGGEGEVPRGAFENETEKLVERLDVAFGLRIPE
ncbi:hypothetical protein O4J56_02250 [Nocardiopsis sp. RSe5-2]|uniref:DUF3558 domain-containing protein n=1 Tax=Nocardiopsis endophytica TaxID=3018445 RepID=A0ABT4TXP0_9ACTN|nr:hypothetical protein [Nocardiopsis endophytica]MDA2809448.1 hypothetical protein [Nocardiopsis endophytica]